MFTRSRRTVALPIAIVLVLALSLSLTACHPGGREVSVAGTSNWVLARHYTQDAATNDFNSGGYGAGWTVLHARADLNAKNQHNPDIMVSEVAQNDAGQWPCNLNCGDGWTEQDRENFRDFWFEGISADTCLVVVLPWSTLDAEDDWPGHNANIIVARADLTSMAIQRTAPTVIADWATVAGPGDIGPDGIHVTPKGAVKYVKMVKDAVQDCTEELDD